MNKYDQVISAVQITGFPVARSNFVVYPEVDTTMRVIDDAIKAGKPDGYTAIALRQTKGRGTGNRKWWSGEGNLMVSRILDLRPTEHYLELDMIAAEAVKQTIRTFIPDPAKVVACKYPNDVLIEDAKISGTLTLPSTNPAQLNMGVGINIQAFPPPDVLHDKPVLKAATSMNEHGCKATIGEVLHRFDVHFYALLFEYRKNHRFETILEKLGFTDETTGHMTVCNMQGQSFSGFYGGFKTKREGDLTNNFICLRTSDGEFEFPTRDLHITSPRLQSTPRHPSLHARYVH